MEYLAVLVVAAAAFGVCFLIDKGFTKLFRSQAQHASGLAVRLNKRYGAIGIVVAALGIGAVVAGIAEQGVFMIVVGAVIMLIGAALIVYYMSFGVFYDEDSFLLTTFGKRSHTYRYGEIRGQQLYTTYGTLIIEIYLTDGRTFQLQSGMSGAYAFLDKAFSRWLEQTGRSREECPFYDPENSCWFPNMEEQ